VQYVLRSAVFSSVTEELPYYHHIPWGELMRSTSYQDSNIYHALITGRPLSGVIHFLKQTPTASFCNKQISVETATYGSDFMVARQDAKHFMDICYTLILVGLPLVGTYWKNDNNAFVITSSTITHFALNIRHNTLFKCVHMNASQLKLYSYSILKENRIALTS
jgi:hypothetical protein